MTRKVGNIVNEVSNMDLLTVVFIFLVADVIAVPIASRLGLGFKLRV